MPLFSEFTVMVTVWLGRTETFCPNTVADPLTSRSSPTLNETFSWPFSPVATTEAFVAGSGTPRASIEAGADCPLVCCGPPVALVAVTV